MLAVNVDQRQLQHSDQCHDHGNQMQLLIVCRNSLHKFQTKIVTVENIIAQY